MISTLRSLLHRRLLEIPSSRVRVYPPRLFSTAGGSNSNNNNSNNNSADPWSSWNTSSGSKPADPADPTSDLPWSDVSSWSTGLTKEHFDGAPVGQSVSSQESQTKPQPAPSAREVAVAMDEEEEIIKMLEQDNRESKKFVDGWHNRMMETYRLLKHVRDPGVRGAYLKVSEKKEMYRLYKEDPEVNNVEKLAKQFRVMRQRVHAILWSQEEEEKEEKKRGKPLDDSVETLLDRFPE